jgi:uncharacterized delta-60 repeat protein
MKNLLWCALIIGSLSVGVSAQAELDTSFNSTGIQTISFGMAAAANDVAVQADNKIVLTGRCAPGATLKLCLARYNENGSLDTTFGGQGFVFTDLPEGFGVAIQGDGKIVAVGYATLSQTSESMAIVRYNSDGTLDSSFGSAGKVIANVGLYGLTRGNEVAIQPDGRILVVGTSAPFQMFPPVPLVYEGFVARYLANGTLDSSFGSGGVFHLNMSDATKATSIALQTDGKILIGGYRDSSNGSLSRACLLVRLSSGGSLDLTWDGDGYLVNGTTESTFESLAVQSDGRVVGVVYGNAVFRFNGDGSLDTSFDGDGIRQFALDSAIPQGVAISAGGRITVVGTGVPAVMVFSRFNAAGSLDTTFGEGGRLTLSQVDGTSSAGASGAAVDARGRIVVGGWVSGTPGRFAVLRFLAPAVSAGISGRVVRPDGRPVQNAFLTIDVGGGSILNARTNPFGYYRFVNVPTGQTYTISARAKRLLFTDRSVFVGNEIANFDFVAEP